MIFEWRSYDLLPGKVPAYIELLQTVGLTIVTRYLPMLGYWFTESGTLNRLHHLWLYQDFEDRAARRTELSAEQVWTGNFIPRAMALVQRQHSCIMRLDQADERFRELCETAMRGPLMVDKASAAARTICQFAYMAAPALAEAKHVARWRVLSGYRVGTFATLTQGGELSEDGGSYLEHELIRPLAFSPL
jgi:NIPSNAP